MKRIKAGRTFWILSILCLILTVAIHIAFANRQEATAIDLPVKDQGSDSICSAEGSPYWAIRYMDDIYWSARSIQGLAGDRYVFAGWESNFRVVELNSTGDPVMQKSYGGADEDEITFIQSTADGGYIVAGASYSFPGGNFKDFWILKLDASGNVSWQKSYGGAREDVARMIRQTSDGGYIVVGRVSESGDEDMLILRLDSDGGVIWQRKLGGDEIDVAFAVQQTPEGGFIVVGRTESYGIGDHNAWAIKLTADGSISWQKTFGSNDWNISTSVVNVTGGGYLLAGTTYTSIDSRGWILKLNTDGTVAWEKTYLVIPYSVLRDVKQTADGGFISVGYIEDFSPSTSDIWLLKVDASGNLQWSKKYDGGIIDRGYSVDQLPDGGYIVGGSAKRTGGDYRHDAFVLRLDGNGNIPDCSIVSNASVTVYSSSATTADTSVSDDGFQLTVTNTAAQVETLNLATLSVCDIPPPALTINYATGAPGSYFTLTGSNFPADSTVNVAVNNTSLGSVSSDSGGNMTFLLLTTNADEGGYVVRAKTGPLFATTSFLLDAGEPLRPQEGSGPIFDVPSNIALARSGYLPRVVGN